MNELMKRDTTVKIFSILFAVILWFFVLDSSNPISSVELSIPLKIEHEDIIKNNGFLIKDRSFPRNVSIIIKGRSDKISSFNTNDAEAILDLSKVKGDETKFLHVDVYINKNKDGISLEGVTPRVIPLELEKVGENPFPVRVVLSGEPKENYKVVSVEAVPETVSIEAADSIINDIGEVKTFVDISDISRDLVMKSDCKVYNKDGNEIVELDKKLSVEVKIELAKEVPIVPSVKGKPSKNFTDGIHKVNPSKALITGSADVINMIDNLRTLPIDIENISESMTHMIDLELPSGVRLVETPRSVRVDVIIERLATKKFTFDSKDIEMENKDDSYKYTIENDNINIDISGNWEELEKISKDSLKPSIDVNGLTEGTYTRVLKVLLPNTVQLLQNYEIRVELKKR
ncbi:MAG: hypothetical protein GX660_11415 [Clostridiaceae bacterium]|nr:hypothetical protein [Clostridiaceae bacterium]